MSVKEQRPEFYNLGSLAGSSTERKKILAIIEELRTEPKPGMVGDYLYVDDLIDYIQNGINPL